MPLHDYKCSRCKTVYELFVPVAQLEEQQWHNCPDNGGIFSAKAERIFLRAPVGFVQKDICYDSPIDGRPITNKHARIEDLRRNNCVEYDPGMKQDAERRRREADEALDKSVDAHVEEYFATAGSRKLETLEQELRAGASAEFQRSTPDLKESHNV